MYLTKRGMEIIPGRRASQGEGTALTDCYPLAGDNMFTLRS